MAEKILRVSAVVPGIMPAAKVKKLIFYQFGVFRN